MTKPDRPIQQPDRHFQKLTAARHELYRLMDRYPSRNADWQAFSDIAEAMDRAAVHFGLELHWWWPSGGNGRVSPHNWSVNLGPTHTKGGWEAEV